MDTRTSEREDNESKTASQPPKRERTPEEKSNIERTKGRLMKKAAKRREEREERKATRPSSQGRPAERVNNNGDRGMETARKRFEENRSLQEN